VPAAPAFCVQLESRRRQPKELHNMQTRYPAFHPEYWVYMLAAFVMVVFGALLYTVDAPINFSSWF
jgi:hypothetical protein